MSSIDTEFLFTNIPFTEAAQICVEDDKLNLIPYDLATLEFVSLLNIATKESVFIFNNRLYKQLDGVAMGSHLAPH